MSNLVWNCTSQGCYKEKKLVDFNFYNDCFPRNIKLTDTDGTVEIGGHFLFIDFKEKGTVLKDGQMVYFERLIKRLNTKFSLFLVAFTYGNKNNVISYAKFEKGKNGFSWSENKPTNKDEFKSKIKRWAKLADGNKNNELFKGKFFKSK